MRPQSSLATTSTSRWQMVIVASMAVIAAGAAVWVLSRFPLPDSFGIDWRGIWRGLQDGGLDYTTGLRNAPWSVLVLLPLGLLPMQAGWAAMAVITMVVLALSVPRQTRMRYMLLSAALLATSFPALRQVADGNTEPLAIVGILLCLHGYRRRSPSVLAAGLLLASGKPQDSWLLLGVLGVYLLRSWPLKRNLALAGIVLTVAIPSVVWFGEGWLQAMFGIQQRGSLMDASLLASLARLELPPPIVAAAWLSVAAVTLYVVGSTGTALTRTKAGLLVAGSLMLAPYSAGNSMLAVLAIGSVSLIPRRTWLGVALIALADVGYLAPQSRLMFEFGALYATGWLAVNWICFAWLTWNDARSSTGRGA